MDYEEATNLLVRTHRHNAQQCTEKFYNWLRTCLTVASGSLALLVGLQNTYVPAHPAGLGLLQTAWGCLCAAIVTCFVALGGEWATHARVGTKKNAAALIDAALKDDGYALRMMASLPPWYCRISGRLFPWVFAASFVLLAVFAVINAGKGH